MLLVELLQENYRYMGQVSERIIGLYREFMGYPK